MELSHFESLCAATFQPSSREQLAEAQKQLMAIQSDATFITQCQYFMDTTQVSYAQMMASNCLEVLVSQFWNSFSLDETGLLETHW